MYKNYKYCNGKMIIGTDSGLEESQQCFDNIGARLAAKNEVIYLETLINKDMEELEKKIENRNRDFKDLKIYAALTGGILATAPLFICNLFHVSLEEMAMPLIAGEVVGGYVTCWGAACLMKDTPSKKEINNSKEVIRYEQEMLSQKQDYLRSLESDDTCSYDSENVHDEKIYDVDNDTEKYDDIRNVLADYLRFKFYFRYLYKKGRLEEYLRNHECNEEAIRLFMEYIKEDMAKKEDGFALVKRRFNR